MPLNKGMENHTMIKITKPFKFIGHKDKEVVVQIGKTICKIIPFAKIDGRKMGEDIEFFTTKYDVHLLREDE